MEKAKPLPDCGAIIEKYLRWMYKVASQQINARKQDVDEAVTNAYFAFLKECDAGAFEIRERGAGEYLRRKVHQEYWNLMRKRNRQEPSLDANDQAADPLVFANPLFCPDPVTSLLDKELSEELSKGLDDCLRLLPLEQREVVLRVYAHESSYEEAATTLAIKVNMVRSRLYMARQKLRACLEKKGYRP